MFDQPVRVLAIKTLEGVFVSFMFIAVSIRLYVRAAITKRWGWDDCENFLATRRNAYDELTESRYLLSRCSMAFGNSHNGKKHTDRKYSVVQSHT